MRADWIISAHRYEGRESNRNFWGRKNDSSSPFFEENMDIYFYYVDKQYIDYLKKREINSRGFTCVPNVEYWNTKKFVFGTVLEVDSINYFVPVSSYSKQQENLMLIRDKKDNHVLGSLRFTYMIPVPKQCIKKLDINSLPTEYNRVHTSKELAFCRRNREKIQKQAQKTYNRVCSKKYPDLCRNSCDFKLLEKACTEYILENKLNQEYN